MTTYPHRLRLHGSRNTHATDYPLGPASPVTSCGRTTGPGDRPEADDAPVTCRACIRVINRLATEESC